MNAIPQTIFQQLIFYGAKRDWLSGQRGKIEFLLTKDINWGELLAQLRYYQISPLFYFNLQRQGLMERFPDNVQKELKHDYLQTHSINLAYYTELKSVLQLFQEAGIDCLVLKGAALAPTVYRNLGIRSFADIDLLLHPEDIDRAGKLLEGRYQCDTPLPLSVRARQCYFHLCYKRKAAPHLSLELHWGFFSPTTPLELDMGFFWRERQSVTAVDCHFSTPGREALFMHQCLHFSGHYFLSWRDLCDIDWFLNPEEPVLDWNAVLKVTKKHHLEARLYYPLLLAKQLLGVFLPHQVMEALEPPADRRQKFQRLFQQHGGVLAEPALKKKDLRGIIDLLLLAPHQVSDFYRRLCWPGIAWLTVFPDNGENQSFQGLFIFLRGIRLLMYIGGYFLTYCKPANK